MNKTQVWKTHPLVRRDFPDILAIEKLSSETPWYPVDYETLMRGSGGMETTGIVVRDRSVDTQHDWGQCVGVCLTRRIGSELHILRLCVDPDWRGKGVGRALFEAVRQRIENNPSRYTIIVSVVHERYYPSATNFLSHVGMRAVGERWLDDKSCVYRLDYKQKEDNANQS